MRVNISKDNTIGFINYIPETKELIVEFPDTVIKNRIIKYLNTEREFWIPESQVLDNYRIDRELPIKNLMYMELALCELYNNIDVWVDWKTQTGGTIELPPPK